MTELLALEHLALEKQFQGMGYRGYIEKCFIWIVWLLDRRRYCIRRLVDGISLIEVVVSMKEEDVIQGDFISSFDGLPIMSV